MSLVHLEFSTRAEPLIWNWYAWSHLISPACAGYNILNRHLKIMDSFIKAPQAHIEALKNPHLIGGPFLNSGLENIPDIEILYEDTKKNCSEFVQLAEALNELDKLLQSKVGGESLESFYSQIPGRLKGFVELVYDLNNHPSIRLIEPLLYRYYSSEQHQSILLSNNESETRSFIMSTPRIPMANDFIIHTPFKDKKLDKLFSTRTNKKEYSSLAKLFNVSAKKEKLFRSLFSTQPLELPSSRIYNGEGLRIRYFGHACVLIQTKEQSILIDPIISYENSSSFEAFTYKDLPDVIDFVFLTHNHQDHVLLETLLQLRYKIKTIVVPKNNTGFLADPSLFLALKTIGFEHVIALEELEKLDIFEGYCIGLPFFGEHGDLNILSKLGYFIQIKGRKLVFLADSNNLEPYLYHRLFDQIGDIQTIFIGMECEGAPMSWLYGPLLTKQLNRKFDQSRRLSGSNAEKAWEIVKTLGCREAYVYALGQEPWLGYITTLNYTIESPQIIEANKFVKKCLENGVRSERLFLKSEQIL